MTTRPLSTNTTKTLISPDNESSNSDRDVFYSLDTSITKKRQTTDEQELTRKMPVPPRPVSNFSLESPDWEKHNTAWAFLQPLDPSYTSKYLTKREPDHNGRVGFLIGRAEDCDVRVKMDAISKQHCLIYMETGATDKAKGIRIYIEDKSFNGTFVNGQHLGNGRRVLLRNGDEIQLLRSPKFHNPDKYKFFRILFPPKYEANTCESEYEFGSLLGSGSFASVRLATHRITKRNYAIKILEKVRFSKKPKMLDSIVNEIGIMNSMTKHPLVVQMIRTFNELQKMYLVLEYVPDGELFQYVVDNKFLDEDTTRFIFWQLFTAIKFLHKNNIAHRDLKPENVLLANRETLHIKVSDFGLAKSEERNQAFDSQCGTPNYIAPEILDPAKHRSYGKKCDLWSLGVMLYICLCGFPPFSEENGPPSMKMQIKTGAYSFPSPWWDKISDNAKDLINKLLTVDPKQRLDIDGALDHDWMVMNAEGLYARQIKLGENVLEQIQALSEPVGYTPTQAIKNTQDINSQK
ncbi:kinase-like domain-containing protein [Gilbertella persicaria]|uniref:kinase-like domain-containing protein n=1 Tax=Gilbertella persicaria TaxID=101096 RepID=UPI00221EAF44|nr:kinase-like domain-containing protein [Gilbertella persicaria]KAI8094833.1 kinase-like domain-containing protein [Gilbertella persicaria]